MIANIFIKCRYGVIIFPVNPLTTKKMAEQIKSSHRRVLSHFVTTPWGKQLMKERPPRGPPMRKIEQEFSKLKE